MRKREPDARKGGAGGQGDWFAAVPRSIARQTAFGVTLLAASLGGFGVWAFSAPLSAAVIAQGSFKATGRNKIVQHLEGGIIQEIMVSEGERVERGQVLVRLDRTEAGAEERSLALRRARLEAIHARLAAERDRRDRVDLPPYLRERMADQEIVRVVRSQALNFAASRRKIESDERLLKANIEALGFRAEGYREQAASMARQVKLLREEFAGKRKLFRKGLLRKPELNALERAINDAEGQIARLEAQVDETGAQIAKFTEQIAQTWAAYQQNAHDEMQTIAAELDGVRERWRSAESVLKRADVAAPVAGTVVQMHYHTAGGVVESGRPIVEILPADVPLIIEVQVPRTEIDVVRHGQEASVRLSALNQRITPVLTGKVVYVSADALPDARAQSDAYVARIDVADGELARVPGFVPTPGMPAEIMIRTADRTFFDYLAQPIRESMSRAFREH